MKKTEKRIFDIIQIGKREDTASTAFDIFITIVILINLFCTFFSTFEESVRYSTAIDAAELVTILIFTVEYILRLWTAKFLYPGLSSGKAVFRFVFSFYGLVDLLTFMPYYLPIVFPQGAVAFRIFRIFRIFRLFKINASYDAFNVISDVLREKKDQLISSMCMILILMLASSLCMYSLEHEAQPENFKNAFSGIWWSVSTLLTVGYGDIYPITIGGRIMAIIISFLGVGMVAIPTGIISAGFVGQYTRIKALDTLGQENSLRFLISTVTKDHPYNGSYIRDLTFPPGIIPLLVVRDEEELLPNDDLKLKPSDLIIIANERSGPQNRRDAENEIIKRERIELREIEIGAKHPWADIPIKSLGISRQEFITMIERDRHVMVPDADTVIRAGDVVLLYSKSDSIGQKARAELKYPF
ncbi:MAG: ion transporter [Lachnospiraceae bacterium]|nr:ion transporter [Lachnospiraceae bacterium]